MTLMTMHNAKGLEYPIVFMIGMEDGVFPHMRSIEAGDVEEERRLAYVGITRAMRELYLTYARTRALFGSRDWNLAAASSTRSRIELTDRRGAARRRGVEPAGAARPWRGERGRARPRGRAPERADASRSARTWCTPTMGEGVVIGVEPGGLIVVRFAADGSERKLMADYAPLREEMNDDVIDGRAWPPTVKERVRARGGRVGRAAAATSPAWPRSSWATTPPRRSTCATSARRPRRRMRSFHHGLPADTPQEEVADLIETLNDDDSVHGILLQLPAPPRSTTTR